MTRTKRATKNLNALAGGKYTSLLVLHWGIPVPFMFKILINIII